MQDKNPEIAVAKASLKGEHKMEKINYFRVEYKVIPASLEEEYPSRFNDYPRYDFNTEMLADKPIIEDYENVFDLYTVEGVYSLQDAFRRRIMQYINDRGKEIAYSNCPK